MRSSSTVVLCVVSVLCLCMASFVQTAGLMVDIFEKGDAEVVLKLRGPSYKAVGYLEVPSDGVVVQGELTVTGVPWTSKGAIEHMFDEDFREAAGIKDIHIENDTVSLGRVPGKLSISQTNDWGKGAGTGVTKGETLSLNPQDGMGFLWDTVLSNASNQQENVKLAVDSNGVTHTVWEDNRKGLDIFYARSVDGIHFTDQKPLDSLQDRFIPQQGPDMAIDDNDIIHVVYADGRTTDDDYDIFYTRSLDGGKTFQGEVRVDHGGTDYQFAPAMAVDGSGSVHIVWEDNRDGNTTLYYSKDRGTEFRVTNVTQGHQVQPDIVVDKDGWVHVAWRDNRSSTNDWKVYHARLPPGGSEFQDETRMDPGPLGTGQFSPVLEVSGTGRLFLAWHDNRAFQYNAYLVWSDNGTGFSTPSRISHFLVTGYSPSMDERDGTLHLTWYDYFEGDANIYYRNSTDDGETFSETMRVNSDNGSAKQRSPALAAGTDGLPRVAWVDFRQHQAGDVFVTRGAGRFVPDGGLGSWADLGANPHNYTGAGWTGDVPVGTAVRIWGRSSPDNGTWSSYVDMVNAPMNLTPDRYLHLTVNLTTLNRAYTPSLEEVWVNYTAYSTTGTLVSKAIETENQVASVTVFWELAPGPEEVDMSISVDGGSTWHIAKNGTGLDLDEPGDSITYKAVLNRTVPGTPVLESIRIDYVEESYPSDLRMTVGDDVVWQYKGELRGSVEVDGIGEAVDSYVASVGNAEDLVRVPVEVRGGTLGDVLLNGLGLDMALPPVIVDQGPKGIPSVTEGEDIILWVSVNEQDGRVLSYSWSADGQELEGATNSSIVYSPPFVSDMVDTRTEHIVVEVSNGFLTASTSWDLEVEPSNRLPIIQGWSPVLGSVLVEEDRDPVEFSVDVLDPDGDDLEYEWTVDGGQVQGVDVGIFEYDPSEESEGEHHVAVKVSDGKGSVTQEWTVIILPVKGDGEDGQDPTSAILMAVLILLVILVCVIVFVENYRRSRGDTRRLRKRLLDEEEALLKAGEDLQEIEREERLLRKGKVDPKLRKRVAKKRKGKGGKGKARVPKVKRKGGKRAS